MVYRADPGPVALKVVELGDRERAADEARLLAALASESEHIVQLRTWFDDGRRLVMVLEYFEHGSVAKQMRIMRGALRDRAAASVVKQVLVALRIVHARGFIHRDVKAANVLVDAASGRCALADFGLAAAPATETVGTPFWLAPEVIASQQAVPVSDVWSVGCLVVECLTGTPPYFALGPMAALFRMVEDDMPPLPPDASPAAAAFLRRCFVRDVDMRPAAAALLDDAWLADAPQIPFDAHVFEQQDVATAVSESASHQ